MSLKFPPGGWTYRVAVLVFASACRNGDATAASEGATTPPLNASTPATSSSSAASDTPHNAPEPTAGLSEVKDQALRDELTRLTIRYRAAHELWDADFASQFVSKGTLSGLDALRAMNELASREKTPETVAIDAKTKELRERFGRDPTYRAQMDEKFRAMLHIEFVSVAASERHACTLANYTGSPGGMQMEFTKAPVYFVRESDAWRVDAVKTENAEVKGRVKLF